MQPMPPMLIVAMVMALRKGQRQRRKSQISLEAFSKCGANRNIFINFQLVQCKSNLHINQLSIFPLFTHYKRRKIDTRTDLLQYSR